MSSPWLLSRTLDPLFAITIGLSATWLRVRREENARLAAAGQPLQTNAQTFDVLKTRLRKVEYRVWKWDWANIGKGRGGKGGNAWGVVDP